MGGVGVLPIMAYKGRLCPKGVLFPVEVYLAIISQARMGY